MVKWMKISAAITLSASIVTGCSQGAPSGNAAVDKPADSKPANAFSEKISINMMSIAYEGGAWSDKHPVIDELNKKLNIDLKIQWVPSDNYVEKLGVMAASNSFPDVFRINSAEFLKWRDKGVFLDIAPILKNYPNLTKEIPMETYAIGNPKGKIYALPNWTPESRETLFIRQDWLTKLNLKAPTTTDELYEVAKAFAKNDPDGNGKDDTIGYSIAIQNNRSFSRAADPIRFAFGLANSWKEVNGAIVPWQAQTKELKDFLGFMSRMYKDGILDKDFAINKGQDPDFKFEANKVGFTDVPATNIYDTGLPNLQKLVPTAEAVQLVPPKGPTGLQGNTTYATTNKVVINAKIDQKKQERIMALMDYMVTPEGHSLITYGVEGIHYKKTGEKYEVLPAFETDRPMLINFWFFHKLDPLNTVRPWEDQEKPKKVLALFDVNKKYAVIDKGAGLFSETSTKSGATLDQKLMSEMVAIIMGEKPVDAIEAAVDAWKKNGGDNIISEMNEQYKLTK
ncbi:extracellular solute-binding protein [Paenibacillus sp. FSL H8-0034]|uniref:extracellular solute-binding protein n=1 Tax=Paenibacillus sp. FSL H8-0034 TaxID=2954671 RepID=UPI0030F8DB1F